MSEYTLTWLPDRRIYRELRDISKTWPQRDPNAMEKLGLVLFEAWSARQRLLPYPRVCVLHRDDEHAGILCGTLWSAQSTFDIQHIVIIPSPDADSALHEEIQQKLVEAAIDFSHDHGFHGWVSCTPEDGELAMWRNLGFSRHRDGHTYRRMGYFAQL